jgi:NADPH-dependent 2,4-dienoyl-CoA reductase/sulfur reductase-like enzyme
MAEKLVVIGGDAAGMSAAAKARRSRDDLEIVVFERSGHTSYSACGMPYLIGGLVEEAEELVVRGPEEFRERYRIDARVRHEVLAIEPAAGRVRVRDLAAGREWWEEFDQLLIATGAEPFCPDFPGADSAGIFGLSTLESGLRVQAALADGAARKAVVVGGGYIGLEMAEALVRRGLEVTLVTKSPEVMPTLDPDMGKLVSEALREVGVTLLLEESLTGFESEDGRVRTVVTERRTLPADLVVLGLGVRPATALAAAAGIPLGVKGALRVNPQQQTEVAGIWAAGDCAESFHLVSRQPVHIALGTVANKQGVVAGTNLGGGYATFPGVIGTAVSKICRYEVARTGLSEEEARAAGLLWTSAVVKSRTRAHYYPGAGRITVKLLARLLGGQIVGFEGAAKRIDIVATAITAGLTAADLVGLDLSYAPPFSPVWDPVQLAARQLI